jgi:hypothetical protein
MTPEEQQLVNELFARLVQLEGTPRDPEAERLIADGVKKAPNAAYALVQTTLVQDEALKRANARIEELQAQLGDAGQLQRRQGGFLDSMRDALLGSNEPPASARTARPRTAQFSSAGAPGAEPQPGFAAPRDAGGIAAQPNFPAGPMFGSGGSFLGTAAAAAAGAIGGGLLRSVFGHRSSFTRSDAGASGGHSQGSALRESSLGDNDLARQGGIDDIDQNHVDQDQNEIEDDGNFGDDDTYADDDTDDA